MKKVFCIFSVVLILIMATVPCFAIDFSFDNQTDDTIEFRYILYPANVLIYETLTPGSVFTISSGESYAVAFYNVENDIYLHFNVIPTGVTLGSSDVLKLSDYDYLVRRSTNESYSRPSFYFGNTSSVEILCSKSPYALNGFTAFYGNLFHVFDYFSLLTSSYFIPFVFVLGIFFILFMIFVIVLIFRRCRS